MPRSKTIPTIVDIAERLGISAMTVSRALNGKADVSKEMRQKVAKCAAALGYQPNRWARSLVTQRSLMIGVMVPEITHSFFSEIIGGVEEVLDKAGYDILLYHSRNDPARERSEIQTLIGGQIDGLIVAPVQPPRSPGLFQDLQKRRVPFVLVDRFFPGCEFSSVRMDDVAAGHMAAEFLIKLGHSKIGHIADTRFSVGLLRRKGFVKALRAHGISVPPEWIVPAKLEIEGGRAAMNKLLQLTARPSAVFTANDPQAIGAIYACREAGLRIPEDISIVGTGNIEGDYHLNPFLTTIDWPRQELGRVAAAFILEALKNGDDREPKMRIFEPRLLIRHSSAAPMAGLRSH